MRKTALGDSYLEVDSLAVRRGNALIFADLSFVLKPGDSLIFSGRNGAGKSTALRALAGLLPLEGGKVSFVASDERDDLPLGAYSHFLGHHNAMKREMTVRENLGFWSAFMGNSSGGPPCSIDQAADAVGLSDAMDIPYGYLSAGQKRRIAFARLLVAYRPVWLLDEPTSSLDSASKALIADLANRHLSSGGMVIAATHEPLAFGESRELRFSGPVDLASDPFLPEAD